MGQIPRRKGTIAAAGLLLVSLPGAGPKQSDLIAYPQEFRSWTHVKSAINEPTHPKFGKFSGIYHIYANETAVRGYRTGRFEDGSVLVFDLNKTVTKDHVTQAAGRHFVDVMVKNSKRYSETGGWGYEEFQGNSRNARNVLTNGQMRCHSCHATQEARDFVFSEIAQ